MASVEGSAEGNNIEAGETTGDDIKEGKDAEVRQAVYDALEAKGQYGTRTSLHAPDGAYSGVKFNYANTRAQAHSMRVSHRGHVHSNRSRNSRFSQGATPRPHRTGHLHFSDIEYAKGEGQQGFWAWIKRRLGW